MKKLFAIIPIVLVALLFAEDTKIERKHFVNFTGGLNTRIDSNLIDESETPSCYNVIWDEKGVLSGRKGTTLKTTLSTPSQILGSYIYRKANGSVWYMVQNGSAVFVSEYEDMTSSASIRTGASTYKPFNFATIGDVVYFGNSVNQVNGWDGVTLSTYSYIPRGAWLASYNNRLWTAGEISNPTQLRYSDIELLPSDSDSWNGVNVIKVGKDDGDRITYIGTLGNMLVIGKERSLWVLTGYDESDFQLRQVSRDVGITDGRSVQAYEGAIRFLGREGFYAFDGANLVNISKKIYFDVKDINQQKGSIREWRTNSTGGFNEGTLTNTDSSTNTLSLADTYKEWSTHAQFTAGSVDASSNVNIVDGVGVLLTTKTVQQDQKLEFTVDVINEDGTSVGDVVKNIRNINDINSSGAADYATACSIGFGAEFHVVKNDLTKSNIYFLKSGADCRIISCKFPDDYEVHRLTWSWSSNYSNYQDVIFTQIKYYRSSNELNVTNYYDFFSTPSDAKINRYWDGTFPNPKNYSAIPSKTYNGYVSDQYWPLRWFDDYVELPTGSTNPIDIGPLKWYWFKCGWSGLYYGIAYTNEIQIRMYINPDTKYSNEARNITMNVFNVELFGDPTITNDTYVSTGIYTSDALTKAGYAVKKFEAFISTPAGTSIVFQQSPDGSTWADMTVTEGDGGRVTATVNTAADSGWRWRAYLYSGATSANTPSILQARAEAVFNSGGTYVSKVFYASPLTAWGLFLADDDTTGGTVAYEIRAGSNTGAVANASYTTYTSGQLITDAATKPYIQWKATLQAQTADVYVSAVTISWYPSYYAKNVASAIYNNRYYCSVSTGTQNLNNIVYVNDFNSGGWTMYTCLNCNTFWVSDQNNMYYGDANTTGKIFQMETGYNDNGSNIKTYWQSKDFDFGYINNDKFPYTFYLYGTSSSNTIPVFVGIARGYETTYTTSTMYLSSAPYTSDYINYNYGSAERFWRYKLYSDTQTINYNIKMTGFEYGIEPWRP